MGYFFTNEPVNNTSDKEYREKEGLKKSKIEININVEFFEIDGGLSTITFTEDATGIIHHFRSVNSSKDLTDTCFLAYSGVEDSILKTTKNFRDCLLRDPYFENNFDIEIVPVETANSNFPFDVYTLVMTSKQIGHQFDCSVDTKLINNYITYDIKIQKSGDNRPYAIAKVYAPQEITLANNPNFVNFSNSYNKKYSRPSQIDLKIKGQLFTNKKGSFSIIFIENTSGGKHTFRGINDDSKLDKNSFLVANDSISSLVKTTYNLRECLMRNDYIRNNFNITVIPPTPQEEFESCGEECFSSVGGTIRLVSNGYGQQYNCKVTTENQSGFEISLDNKESIGTDSIDNGLGNYSIELDVYTDNGIEWGKQNKSSQLAGKYLTTLSKSYFGRPLWFELNTLMSKKVSYSPLFLTAFDKPETSWIDAGTITNYRFVARRTGQNNTEPIYLSDILYTINGYDYTLNDSHLGHGQTDVDNYILDLSLDFDSKDFVKVKPLTTNTERTHIKGLKQYFNCILKSKPFDTVESIEIAVLYKLYTQSGKAIAIVTDLWTNADNMQTMNTTQLKLDQFLPSYDNKTVGRIDVCLITPSDTDPTKTYIELSDTISYRILPSALHTVKDFAFLNRLGGWDSMNFGGSSSNEFKVTSSSIFKTLQPGFSQYSEIESVSSKSVEEKLTVQSSPLRYEVVEWLREMAASPAVYELSTRRYILIDDMTLKYNSKDDLFQIDLKYHYSDIFNGRMR